MQENVGHNPNEKFMCKKCWMKMETFHELYRLVKINYNMHPEENVQSEVIEIKTEEEKFKGEAKFINRIEKRLNFTIFII